MWDNVLLAWRGRGLLDPELGTENVVGSLRGKLSEVAKGTCVKYLRTCSSAMLLSLVTIPGLYWDCGQVHFSGPPFPYPWSLDEFWAASSFQQSVALAAHVRSPKGPSPLMAHWGCLSLGHPWSTDAAAAGPDQPVLVPSWSWRQCSFAQLSFS